MVVNTEAMNDLSDRKTIFSGLGRLLSKKSTKRTLRVKPSTPVSEDMNKKLVLEDRSLGSHSEAQRIGKYQSKMSHVVGRHKGNSDRRIYRSKRNQEKNVIRGTIVENEPRNKTQLQEDSGTNGALKKRCMKPPKLSNVNTPVSEDMNKKLFLEDRSLGTHSEALRVGKYRSKISHVVGRPKGHSDRRIYRSKRNQEKNVIRGTIVENEPLNKTQLQEDSGALKKRDTKPPKLSNVRNWNFRVRLYRELNVVSKPIKLKRGSLRSKSNPITLNREQKFNYRGSAYERKFSSCNGSTRQSLICLVDEEVFVLDI